METTAREVETRAKAAGSEETERNAEADEVQKQLEKLGLKEEESKRVVEIKDDDIDETDRDFQSSVACKSLSIQTIKADGFSNLMPKIWGLEGNIKITKAGKNLFICKFRNQRFKNRVIWGGPWSFDDAIILFEEPKGNSSIEELDFRYVDFLVHFHNLPRVCFCRKYAEALGNSIEKFMEAESDEKGKMEGENLRVKVRLDINQPLRRGTNIKTGSMAEKKWIKITYEKLPDFCYFCGKLRHIDQECEEEGADRTTDRDFGVDLRETQSSKWIFRGKKRRKQGLGIERQGEGQSRQRQRRK